MVKRTATFAFLALAVGLILLSFRYIDSQDRAIPTLPQMTPPQETILVLPPVSDAWSNFTIRSSVVTAAVDRPLEPAASTVVENPNPDREAVESRANELLARLAVDSVGLDPDADQYWLAGINDPRVAAEDRQELIEALSQAGFADARQTTAEDLPLIATRIALLEEVSPTAIDQVNASAFQDVYHQLLEMFASLTAPEPATNTFVRAE
jgi:hypothetical protein